MWHWQVLSLCPQNDVYNCEGKTCSYTEDGTKNWLLESKGVLWKRIKGKLGLESPDYNIAALLEDNLAVGEVGIMAIFNGLRKYNL